ncbi:MAG: hypothetical protein AAB728_01010, partial [Patescibacteria group bacterium]
MPLHHRFHLLLDLEVPVRRTQSVQGLVGPLVVVELHPVRQPLTRLLERLEPGALQELLLQRFPEPFDLSQRL